MTFLESKAQQSFEALLEWHQNSRTSHLSSSLSCLDILNYLLRARMDLKRDVLVLSKGHAASALYVILSEEGFIDPKTLLSYGSDRSSIAGHVSWTLPRPVLCASGSLGYGTGVASGWAYAERLKHPSEAARAFCIVSDGELNTGVFWESLLSISHLKILNLEIYVDANGLQAYGNTDEVLNMGSLSQKFEAFGFETIEINGHSYEEFLNLPNQMSHRPRIIICNTQKGRRLFEAPQSYEVHYHSQ